MFVSFINEFTQIRKVTISCQKMYVICCRLFYVKPALFIELYLTLQTDFAARRCFWFSANDSSIEQICPPCFQDLLLGHSKKTCVEPKQKYKWNCL